MVEFDRYQNTDKHSGSRLKVTVVGIGGGGLNVLDRISLDRMMDASLLAMDTDIRDLNHSMAPSKIQLGASLILGIGSGGDPDLGAQAAEATASEIRGSLHGSDIVFICGGLGGGTCSGAAPVVADIAKKLGAMVFVFASMPFAFQGRRTVQQAEQARKQLQSTADALILFENSRMGELVLPKEGIQKAFSQADQLIGHSIRAISSIVNQRGLIGMNIADVMRALRNPDSRCLFGYGEARGQNRVQEVLKRAMKSPLINEGDLLTNSKNLLVHIAGGENFTLDEVQTLMSELGKKVPDTTRIMFGLASDPKLGDSVCLTLLSSLTAEEVIPQTEVQIGGYSEPKVEETVVASVAEKAVDVPEKVEVHAEAQVEAAQPEEIKVEEKVEPVQSTFSQQSEPRIEVKPIESASVQPPVDLPIEVKEVETSVEASQAQASDVQKAQTPEVQSSFITLSSLVNQAVNETNSQQVKIEFSSPEAKVLEVPANESVTPTPPPNSQPVTTSLFKVVEETPATQASAQPATSPSTAKSEPQIRIEDLVNPNAQKSDWLEKFINASSQPAAGASSNQPVPQAPQQVAAQAAPAAAEAQPPVQTSQPAQSVPQVTTIFTIASQPAVQSKIELAPQVKTESQVKETPVPAPQAAPNSSNQVSSIFTISTASLKDSTSLLQSAAAAKTSNPEVASSSSANVQVKGTKEENLDVPTWLRLRNKGKF